MFAHIIYIPSLGDIQVFWITCANILQSMFPTGRPVPSSLVRHDQKSELLM